MDNIEVNCLHLGHIIENYFSSYFSLLREVCDDQHDHTHKLGERYIFFTEEYEIYYIIYWKVEVRLNAIHNIDKKSNQNMSYTTWKNYHTQHRRIFGFGFTSNEVTYSSVPMAACPPFRNEMQISSIWCLLFVPTYVSITEKENVFPVAPMTEMF